MVEEAALAHRRAQAWVARSPREGAVGPGAKAGGGKAEGGTGLELGGGGRRVQRGPWGGGSSSAILWKRGQVTVGAFEVGAPGGARGPGGKGAWGQLLKSGGTRVERRLWTLAGAFPVSGFRVRPGRGGAFRSGE